MITNNNIIKTIKTAKGNIVHGSWVTVTEGIGKGRNYRVVSFGMSGANTPVAYLMGLSQPIALNRLELFKFNPNAKK
jgi:hypothetical protein